MLAWWLTNLSFWGGVGLLGLLGLVQVLSAGRAARRTAAAQDQAGELAG